MTKIGHRPIVLVYYLETKQVERAPEISEIPSIAEDKQVIEPLVDITTKTNIPPREISTGEKSCPNMKHASQGKLRVDYCYKLANIPPD